MRKANSLMAHLKKDKVKLAKVHGRATQMIKGLEPLPFEARLKCLGAYMFQKETTKGRCDIVGG